MAIDHGSRRLGIAVSDETGLLATPIAVIERRSRAADLARLTELVNQYQPCELLVGLPLRIGGEAGSQAAASEQYAAWLRNALGLPVQLWNERYSSLEAQARRATRGRRSRRGAYVDAEAAAIFLQDYLDARR